MGKKADILLSHWFHLIEGLQYSPQRFYLSIKEAIKRRQLSGITLSGVEYYEGAPLISPKRVYLRVKRNEHVFDICAAPFGNGFFISWWFGEKVGLLYRIPIIGLVFMLLFRPSTYYRHDTALMFQESIHAAVIEVLEQTTQAKGMRGLSEMEKKPILSDLLKRKR
jgi:hypothetical protein